jgi:oligoendopeptidase F
MEIDIKTRNRSFLANNLAITDWNSIKYYFEDLINRPLHSKEDFEKWLYDRSELEAVMEEDLGWRYIRMSCDTTNQEYKKSYELYIENIEPHTTSAYHLLNKKLIASPFVANFENDSAYSIYFRGIKKQIDLFREENIPLQTEISIESQKYGAIAGSMTVELNGKELTLQQAAKFLKDDNRNLREETYLKITKRRIKEKDNLNTLYTSLIHKRTQLAKNAGFSNFRDYMFQSLGRFDYAIADCFNFHQSIESEITPILDVFDLKRKTLLKLEELKPWDMDVDLNGSAPLKPFETTDELIEKTIKCFNYVYPPFAENLSEMKHLGHLDLESRKGKAPGGYNYPLYECGIPFIFMNAVGTLTDLVTMVHEGGHAVHSFLSRHLPITEFKSVPSEVAELASMGMELISMEHWHVFFNDINDLKRAKREQLEKVLRTLPWVATIDKFQHWIYENPNHSLEERQQSWTQIMNQFSSQIINWSGVEEAFENTWQKQLHLFEVPFYYIEYGMAQLGAIALWKNYKENPTKTLQNYINCLQLGYTRSIPQLYQAAGIEFNFSKEYVKGLADFVKAELKKLD